MKKRINGVAEEFKKKLNRPKIGTFDFNDSFSFQDWIRKYEGKTLRNESELYDLSRVAVVINRINMKVIVKNYHYAVLVKTGEITYDDFEFGVITRNYSKMGHSLQKGDEKVWKSFANFTVDNTSSIMCDDYFFDPTPTLHNHEKVFNAFEGLLVQPKDNKLDIFPLLAHVYEVLGNNDVKCYEYIMRWLKRSILQRYQLCFLHQ
jgi:hypothetical protein